jgi:hypothetical protein
MWSLQMREERLKGRNMKRKKEKETLFPFRAHGRMCVDCHFDEDFILTHRCLKICCCVCDFFLISVPFLVN